MTKRIILILSTIGIIFSGCGREAHTVSYNISRDADSFKIKRRVVFFNGITGKNVMSIMGYCSIEKDNIDKQLEITCKVGRNKYKKHYFGLSDNTSYFVEQVDSTFESEFNYKVVFRPQTLLPDITIKVSNTNIIPTPKVDVVETK